MQAAIRYPQNLIFIVILLALKTLTNCTVELGPIASASSRKCPEIVRNRSQDLHANRLILKHLSLFGPN